jgi:CRP-like cAMP-binding protein
VLDITPGCHCISGGEGRGAGATRSAQLAHHRSLCEHGSGGIGYRAGEPGTDMFIIMEGEVAVDQDHQRMGVLGVHAYFGEM